MVGIRKRAACEVGFIFRSPVQEIAYSFSPAPRISKNKNCTLSLLCPYPFNNKLDKFRITFAVTFDNFSVVAFSGIRENHLKLDFLSCAGSNNVNFSLFITARRAGGYFSEASGKISGRFRRLYSGR
jgi:hypothetical protein